MQYKERVAKRTNQVNVRLSDGERSILAKIAERTGLEDSAVLRMALLEYDRQHPVRSEPESVASSGV